MKALAEKKPIILIVDDEPESLRHLGEALSDFAFVRVAVNGDDALTMLREGDYLPDIILLDVMMPVMDGYETCRRIRNLPKAKDIPVIFVTSLAAKENELKGLTGGALDFINKPFDVSTLVRKVLNHIEINKIQSEALQSANERLRDQEETTRTLIDGLPDVIMRFNPRGEYLFVSQSVHQAAGLQPGQFLGKTFKEFGYPGRPVQVWEEALHRVFRTRQPFETEFSFRGPEGNRIHNWRLLPECNADGEARSVLTISRDVTQERLALQQANYHKNVGECLAVLAQELLFPRTLQETADKVLEAARKLTSSPCGFVGEIEPGAEALTLLSVANAQTDWPGPAQEKITLQEFSGLWGWVLRNKEPVLSNAPGDDPRSSGVPNGHVPIHSFLSLPVMQKGRLLGIIALANAERPYTQDDLDILQRLATIFALAVIKCEEHLRLKASEEKAQEANRQKSLFLANMSHEIRTPVNGVMGMLQLLKTTPNSSDQGEYLEMALASVRRLSKLLEDILNIAELEFDNLKLNHETIDIRATFKNMESLFAPAAMLKGVPITFYVNGKLGQMLMGDSSRLEQVLANLVGNALKYTEHGRVSVEAHPLPPRKDERYWVLFSISDTGVGIAEENLERIFEAFRQEQEGYTRRHQGAGLGLTLSKRLVDLMGGSISIASEPGVGTTVHFCSPFGVAEETKDDQETPQVNLSSGLHILVAEDDYVSRLATATILEKLEHTVISVNNGQQALDMLQQHAIDAVFMDVQMPVLDGVETAKRIRNGEAGEHNIRIPIIALTAYAMPGDREKFLQAGMDAYIAKPMAIEELQNVLNIIRKE